MAETPASAWVAGGASPVNVVGIVLAAGSGERFGGPKQDELIAGETVVERAMRTAVEMCDRVVLVHRRGGGLLIDWPDCVVGGSTRSASVRAGLAAAAGWGADIMVVHCAARPLASTVIWSRVIRAVQDGAVCAVPVVPIVDSMRASAGGPADRSDFVAVQTPQAFQASVLYALHDAEPECSDDAGLITSGVEYVRGDPANIKITNRGDLDVAACLLRSM